MSAKPEIRPLFTSSGFRDGLGERVLAFDRPVGEVRERLRVRPELAAFEVALGAQIDRMSKLTDPRFPTARDVDRDRVTGQVVVVSDYAPGERLSDLLCTARERGVFPDIGAALQTTGELLLAMASFSGSVKMSHGAISPSRLVISGAGDVIITDYLFASILSRLRFSPARLWRELAITGGADGVAFDEAGDVRQIALVLMAMALGRPIEQDEYPSKIAALVTEVCDVALISGGEGLATGLRAWLERALNLEARQGFGNIAHACASFGQLTFDGGGLAGSRAALVAFLDELARAPQVEPQPVAPPPMRLVSPPAVLPAPTPTIVIPVPESVVIVAPEPVVAPEPEPPPIAEPAPVLFTPPAPAPEPEPSIFREPEPVPIEASFAVETPEPQTVAAPEPPAVEAPPPIEPLRGFAATVPRLDLPEPPVDRPDAVPDEIEIAARAVEPEPERREVLRQEEPAPLEQLEPPPIRSKSVVEAPFELIFNVPAERVPEPVLERYDPPASAPAPLEPEPPEPEPVPLAAEPEPIAEPPRLIAPSPRVIAPPPPVVPAPPPVQYVDPPPAYIASPPVYVPAPPPPLVEPPPSPAEAPRPVETPPPVHYGPSPEESIFGAPMPAASSSAPDEWAVEESDLRQPRERDEPRGKKKKKFKKLKLRKGESTPPPPPAPPAYVPPAAPLVSTGAMPDLPPPGVAPLPPPSAPPYPSMAMPDIPPPGVVPLPPPVSPFRPAFPSASAPPVLTQPVAPGPIRLKDPSPEIVARARKVEANKLDFTPRPNAPPRPATIDMPDRSRGGLMKLAAALIVLALAGFGAMKFWPRAAAEPGMLTVETTPAGSQVYVDGDLKGKTPMTLAVQPGKHELKLMRRGATHVRSVAIEEGKTRTERYAWPRPRATGRGGLRVSSEPPGAKVYVDGKLQGQTPLDLPNTPVGNHTVLIESASGSVRRTVNVVRGEEALVDVELYSGFVRVFAPVELQLSTNGVSLSATGSDPIMLPPGPREILAVNAELGYHEVHKVDVEPGETKTLNITPVGRLSINATPWAEVWVDGLKVGQTPIANRRTPIGTHALTVRHPEYGERRIVVTVTYGAPTAVSVDLTKP